MKHLFKLIAAINIGLLVNAFSVALSYDNSSNVNFKEFSKNEGILFVENKGQVRDVKGNYREEVLYTTSANGMNLMFNENSIYFVIQNRNDNKEIKKYRFDLNFVNSNRNLRVLALNETKSYYNYFNKKKSFKKAKTYKRIVYKELYPNIDMVFYGVQNMLKYDIVVKPGGNLSDIKFKYKGLKSITQNDNGSIILKTPLGNLQEQIPNSYQLIKTDEGNKVSFADRVPVNTTYLLNNNQIGFKVDNYNKNHPLVIDPAIQWATYLGGSNEERVGYLPTSTIDLSNESSRNFSGGGAVYDSDRNLIVAMSTKSTSLPDSIGQMTFGDWEVYVAKYRYNDAGEEAEFIWGGYVGDRDDEYVSDITVDDNDNIFIVGATNDTIYPVTMGALQTDCASCPNLEDAFITKLDTDGSILNSTLWGGSGADLAHAVSIDESGFVYVIGETRSSDFPRNAYSSDTTCASCPDDPDIFIAKFPNNMNSFYWSRYLGGNNSDYGLDIVAKRKDAYSTYVFLTGATNSTDYPTLNPMQNTLNFDNDTDSLDAIITMLDGSTSTDTVLWSTYLGGSWEDFGLGIAAKDDSTFAICGFTQSDSTDEFMLMEIPKYWQSRLDLDGTSNKGDGFVAAFTRNSNTCAMYWSTYLGGSEEDRADDISYLNDHYYITGYTHSSDLPLLHPFQKDLGQGNYGTDHPDAFVLDFEFSGIKYWANYYGGNYKDFGSGIDAFDSSANSNHVRISIAGETREYAGQPKTIILDENPVDGSYGGGDNDAFVSTFYGTAFPTHLGGSNDDYSEDMVIDEFGYIYITGVTYSNDFPATTGAYDETNNGSGDVYIAKYNNTGRIEFVTFFGGDSLDHGKGITKDVSDEDGDLFIVGYTRSHGLASTLDANYYSHQDTLAGDTTNPNEDIQDGFVMCLNATGDTLKWFTYWGPRGDKDVCEAVTYSDSSSIYVTGSLDTDFNTLEMRGDSSVNPAVSPYQDNPAGDCTPTNNRDAFIAKFLPNGYLQWSSYWGGLENETGLDVDWVPEKNWVAFVGWTFSDEDMCFPLYDAYDDTFNDPSYPYNRPDAFFSVVDSSGRMITSTYLGGEHVDTATCIWADYTGNGEAEFLIGGHTESYQNGRDPIKYRSSNPSFPITSSFANQRYHGNNLSYFDSQDSTYTKAPRELDCFISRFDYDASNFDLGYSSYIGGGIDDTSPPENWGDSTGRDLCYDIIGSDNYVYITGGTISYNSFYSSPGLYQHHNGYLDDYYDSYITAFDRNDLVKEFGTYYGYVDNQWGTAVGLDLIDKPIICGNTDENLDTPIKGLIDYLAEQKTLAGDVDVFIAKFYEQTLKYEKRSVADFQVYESKENPILIDIYPNPGDKYINVKTTLRQKSNIWISLYDINGRDIMKFNSTSGKGDFEKILDLSGLSSGVYLINVIVNDRQITKTFIKN